MWPDQTKMYFLLAAWWRIILGHCYRQWKVKHCAVTGHCLILRAGSCVLSAPLWKLTGVRKDFFPSLVFSEMICMPAHTHFDSLILNQTLLYLLFSIQKNGFSRYKLLFFPSLFLNINNFWFWRNRKRVFLSQDILPSLLHRQTKTPSKEKERTQLPHVYQNILSISPSPLACVCVAGLIKSS